MVLPTNVIRRWATEGFPDLEEAFDRWLSKLVRMERKEAWVEGRNSADTEYEHIFKGHPVPEGEMCEECAEVSRNPYQAE